MSNAPKPPIQFPSEAAKSRRHLIICAIIFGGCVVVAIVGMVGIMMLMFLADAVNEDEPAREEVAQEEKEEVTGPRKTKKVRIRVNVFDQTEEKPIPGRAEIWFRGHGSWFFRPDIEFGFSASKLLDYRETDMVHTGDDGLVIYPDGRQTDSSGR